MDHETATRSHAAERYILGDLPFEERDAFEEHFSDCSRCMNDVTSLDAFAANAQAEFQSQNRLPHARPRLLLAALFPRLTSAIAFSGTLNLVLVAIIGYGALRFLPSMRTLMKESGDPRPAQILVVYGTSRGASGVYTISRSGALPIFRFDLPQQFAEYRYSIERPTGGFHRSGPLAVAAGAERVDMAVPVAGLAPGDYMIQITGLNGATSQEISSWNFRVTQ